MVTKHRVAKKWRFITGACEHRSGIAPAGRYVEESPAYKAVGALGMKLGLEWGGNWKTIQDEPHFQLRPEWARKISERDMLAELRHRNTQSIAVFAT